MYTSHNYYFTYYKKKYVNIIFQGVGRNKNKNFKHNKAIKTEIIDILLNSKNSKEYKINKQIKKHDDDEKNNRLVSYNVLVAAVNMQNKRQIPCAMSILFHSSWQLLVTIFSDKIVHCSTICIMALSN